MDLKSAALEHAKRGRHVFPVSWDKKPLYPWGPGKPTSATTNPQTISGWWDSHPTALIGIATGPSGLFVLDVDCKKGAKGMETMEALRAVLGELPETLTVTTASGGLHFYFRLTPRLEQASIRASAEGFDGVDWRGKGGFVVAPPSRNGQGQWTYHGPAPIADLPGEWVEAILEASHAAKVKASGEGGNGIIPEGRRDDELFRIGARYRAQGATPEQVNEYLQEVNRDRCKPPLLPGQVEKIAESASKYDPMEMLTDQGNGQRLAVLLKHRAVYVGELAAWYQYDGHVWTVAHSKAFLGWAQELTRNMRLECVAIGDEEKRKTILKHAVASETLGRARAMAECASQPDLLGVGVADLDRNPYTWNMAEATLVIDPTNGDVDFHEHRAADLLTKMGGASGKPAFCPVWAEHLERVLPDPEARDYFQRAIGYTLEPGQKEKVLHVVHGPKDSGKSLTINTLARAFGTYHAIGDLGAFAPADGGGKNTPQLAALRGARLVIVPEIPRGKVFEAATIKRWTGGDAMTATPKFGHQFTFMPEGKLLFTGNELPAIHATDDATWRRLRIVGFNESIPEDEQDSRLGERFSLDGVWAWIVEGFMAYRERGLLETAAMRAHRERERGESNPMHEFAEECLELGEDFRVNGDALRSAITNWTRREGRKPIGLKNRVELLKQLGMVQLPRTARGITWAGGRLSFAGKAIAGCDDDGVDPLDRPVH